MDSIIEKEKGAQRDRQMDRQIEKWINDRLTVCERQTDAFTNS
jgi:hypothetical protein